MTSVVNISSGASFDVYIGRPARGRKGSPFGNPFKIGRDGTREEVIAKYRVYLLGRLPGLRGKILGCWCAPSICHGDVLAEMVEALP